MDIQSQQDVESTSRKTKRDNQKKKKKLNSESNLENDLIDLEIESSDKLESSNLEEYKEQSQLTDKKYKNVKENLNLTENIGRKKRNKNTKKEDKKVTVMKTTQKSDANEEELETILDFDKLNLLDKSKKKFVDKKNTPTRSAKCIEDGEKIENRPKRQPISRQTKLLAKELNYSSNISEKDNKADKQISVSKNKLKKDFNKRSVKVVANTLTECNKNLDEKNSSESSSIIKCSDKNLTKDSITKIDKSKTTDVKDKTASYNVSKSNKEMRYSMKSITESIVPIEDTESPMVTTETNLDKILSSTLITGNVQTKLYNTHYSEISEIVSLPTKTKSKGNFTNILKEDDNSSLNIDHIDNEDEEFNEVQIKEVLEDIELAYETLKEKDEKKHNNCMKKNKRKNAKKMNKKKK